MIVCMNKIKTLSYASMLAILISLSAYIAIPLPGLSVSFTLQTLMIMIIGLSMPFDLASLSVVLYLLLGAIGLPVFSHGQAGLTTLFGPTGGYLFGFVFAVMFMSFYKTSKLWTRFLSAVVGGIILVYLFGVIGLIAILEIDIYKAVMIGVIPFIVLDSAKALIAAWFVSRYQSFFKRFGR